MVDGEAVKNPPRHVHVSVEYIGLNEYNDRVALKNYVGVDPKYYEWCAAFLNAVLEESGMENLHDINHVSPLMARSFLKWGLKVDVPMAGDVVIFPRGNSDWKGHVGLALNSKFLIHAYGPEKKVIVSKINVIINKLQKKRLSLLAIKRYKLK